jgi:undecaprenyl-diphosphatase
METWHVVLLALIQALTEFLPVSSSGHLALVGFFLGWPYQGLTFDLALHFGTLIAVVTYFWRDLMTIARETLKLRRWSAATPVQRMGVGIVVATIPAGIAGLLMPDAFVESLRAPVLVAMNLIVFGVLLGVADRWRRGTRGETSLGLGEALLIGTAQALALVPGTSRSGITLTAGLALGMERNAAARYSFLMSVPITALAAGHGLMTALRGDEPIGIPTLLLGAAISAIAGIAVIHLLLAMLRRTGTLPFVVYRIVLGVVVLVLVARGGAAPA